MLAAVDAEDASLTPLVKCVHLSSHCPNFGCDSHPKFGIRLVFLNHVTFVASLAFYIGKYQRKYKSYHVVTIVCEIRSSAISSYIQTYSICPIGILKIKQNDFFSCHNLQRLREDSGL